MTNETKTVLRQTLVALEARAAEQMEAWGRTCAADNEEAQAGGKGAMRRKLNAARADGQRGAHTEHVARLRTLIRRLDSDPEAFDPALLINVLAGRA